MVGWHALLWVNIDEMRCGVGWSVLQCGPVNLWDKVR